MLVGRSTTHLDLKIRAASIGTITAGEKANDMLIFATSSRPMHLAAATMFCRQR